MNDLPRSSRVEYVLMLTLQEESEVLERLECFLKDHISPKASQIDQHVPELTSAFRKMADGGLLGLRVPVAAGGIGLSDLAFRRAQEAIARRSGALAFLQTQHQSGSSFIATSLNRSLRENLLADLAKGNQTIGIAFSQLRKPGPPGMTAERVEGGYVLNGTAPWISGWEIFDLVCIAAVLPSEESVWGVIPLENGPNFQASPVMRLAALEVVQTVSAKLKDLFLPDDSVLFFKPPRWIHENDSLTAALQSPFALGCAQAAIDVMRSVNQKRNIKSIAEAAGSLEAELEECRKEAYTAMGERENLSRSLSARAWAVELMGRCAHSAVIASAGAGNSMEHAAQRVYREALVFSVSAQTEPIVTEALKRLVRD